MIHWHNVNARHACLVVGDPRSTLSTDSDEVNCPRCRVAIRSFVRATDETVKNAPAVVRA